MKTPTFTEPDQDLQFLASPNALYDYGHLFHFAEKLADAAREMQISQDHPLLICTESSDELVFLIAACYLLNLPFISVHPDIPEDDWNHITTTLNPAALFATSEVPSSSDIPLLSADAQWLSDTSAWNSVLFTLQKPDSVAGFFLTSGTTSRPKIVPVKRRQILFAAGASSQNFKPSKNRYWLLCLPLNHIGGISIILRSLLYNSAVYRIQQFDANEVRTFLSENRLFEAASLVPTMLIRLIEDPLFQVHRKVKALLLGGGPIGLELINRSVTRGIPIVTSYGMTETCAQIAANPMLNPSGIYTPKSSVGRIFSPNEVQIRDDSGKVVSQNEHGQIWLRGPQIFDGYAGETSAGFFDSDGWFNTGDYGHLNRNRQLFIENRRTDIVVTGGENVNVTRVEQILNLHSDVAESAVFGVPDAEWGQRLVAFVVTPDNDPGETTLKKHLKTSLRGFQVPKEIFRIDKLPKTSLGKLKRGALQGIYKKYKGR